MDFYPTHVIVVERFRRKTIASPVMKIFGELFQRCDGEAGVCPAD